MHKDNDNINKVGEVMRLLIRTQGPPENGLAWRPAHTVCEHPLNPVNDAVNNKIQNPKPPKRRRKYHDNNECAKTVNPRMG